MLKDIVSIQFRGACFDTITNFKLFDSNKNEKPRITLLYGRNGSGKSTIATAFNALKEENNTIQDLNILDGNNNTINLTEEEKKKIFVFDEKFIDKTVKLKSNSIDTIVLLGESASLSEEIEKAQEELKKNNNDKANKESIFNSGLNNSNDLSCPLYHKKKLKSDLQGDNNWADRDRRIKNNKTNTQVKDDTYLQFVNRPCPSKPRDVLLIDFKEMLTQLKTAKSGENLIKKQVPFVNKAYFDYDENKLLQILSKEIEQPVLSEREKTLLKLLEEGINLNTRITEFKSNSTKTCPYCLQPLTEEYKDSLIKSMEKVLNKQVENHQEILKTMFIEPLNLELEQFGKLNSFQCCISALTSVNELIDKINLMINKKISSPYQAIKTGTLNLIQKIEDLSTLLITLEKERVEYNKNASNVEAIKKKLDETNSDIAYYDLINTYNTFIKQQKLFDKSQKEIKEIEKNIKENEKRIEDLDAKRKNVQIAVNEINSCMNYIFYDNNRLSIEYSNGEYLIKSHGKSVTPNKISIGERNIIGLCYFFTSIFEGQNIKQAYNNEYLIIIDDPISSFDVDNRVGIISFLRYKLNLFLLGNINTKTLIMTHDLPSYYNIDKIFKDIEKSSQNKSLKNWTKQNIELSNGIITNYDIRKRQEYTELIDEVFNFANNKINDYSLTIGNAMRQVLEAFSTFSFKKSIEEISTDDSILSLLGKDEYKSYFSNLMYRLVLNGGSHQLENVQAMYDLNFFEHITVEEKRRTAKDILCFIYLLNKKHLIQHLTAKGNANCESILNGWCQDILSKAPKSNNS